MIALAVMLALEAAPDPSFDCGRATSTAERLICADPGLAAQDARLATLYRRALAAAPDPDAVRRDETAALRARAGCADSACLRGWYLARLATLSPPTAAAAHAPASLLQAPVGTCAVDRVARVGTRFENDPTSGSAVAYVGGVHQVSYDVAPGVAGWRPGDPVRICVASRPRDCPPGDDRGSRYAATNLRTGGRFEAFDSQHMCGGA